MHVSINMYLHMCTFLIALLCCNNYAQANNNYDMMSMWKEKQPKRFWNFALRLTMIN